MTIWSCSGRWRPPVFKVLCAMCFFVALKIFQEHQKQSLTQKNQSGTQRNGMILCHKKNCKQNTCTHARIYIMFIVTSFSLIFYVDLCSIICIINSICIYIYIISIIKRKLTAKIVKTTFGMLSRGQAQTQILELANRLSAV